MSKLMPRVIHFWSAMLNHLPVVATTELPVYSKRHTIGSRTPKHMQQQTGSFAEWYLYKVHLVCRQPGRLQCSETDKPLHNRVICCICLIADCILSNFFTPYQLAPNAALHRPASLILARDMALLFRHLIAQCCPIQCTCIEA